MDDLKANDFIKEFASFIHTTSSHKPDDPHLRVVFIFEKMITDLQTFKDTATGLSKIFDGGGEPPATKTAVKIWSGAKGCEVYGIWSFVPAPVMEYLRRSGEYIPPPVENFTPRKVSAGRYEKYIAAMLDGVENDLAECKPKNRNNPLNKAAYRLGQFAGASWNDFSHDDAMAFLVAKTKDFWGDVGHRITATRAISDGMTKPETPPKDNFKEPLGRMI